MIITPKKERLESQFRLGLTPRQTATWYFIKRRSLDLMQIPDKSQDYEETLDQIQKATEELESTLSPTKLGIFQELKSIK